MLALGIGILISALLMNSSYKAKYKSDVEMEARKLGMVYPDEIKMIEINP